MWITRQNAIIDYNVKPAKLRRAREAGAVKFRTYYQGKRLGYEYDEEQLKKWLAQGHCKPRPQQKKICPYCCEKFEATSPAQIYCSKECERKAEGAKQELTKRLTIGEVLNIMQDLNITYKQWAQDRNKHYNKWLEQQRRK